jgi:DNA-binding SARP family transcriptional activator
MRTLGSFFRLLSAVALVAAIALLIASRPALPVATAVSGARRVDEMLIFIAWLGCLLLTVGLLYRIAARKRSASPTFLPPLRHLHPPSQAKPMTAAGYSVRAFPLILQRPHAPLEHPHGQPQLEPAQPAPAADVDPESQRVEAGTTISLLGPLTISGGRKHLRRLRGPTKELLCYLALHPSGAHRDQIVDALWPDQPPDQGRKRLWRAAGDVRSHFGDTILNRDGDHYQLDRTRIAIDLDQLEQLITALENAESLGDQVPLLKRALALFRGEPLTGSDYPWAENEQRRLHAVHLDLLDRAGHACLALADPAGALGNAEAGLAVEPYNEHLARLAMEAEAALGLRSAVIDRYQQLSHTLQQQLGLEPHSETKRLYRRLLAQDDPTPAARQWGC